jgi:phage gp36-like protein
MTYATQTDLEARMAPELALLLADDAAQGAPAPELLEGALTDAQAEIDRALEGRYLTPVDPAPPILTRWCADLALENLFLRRRALLPREHAERAALARRALTAIADGLAGLAGATPLLERFASENTRRGDAPDLGLDELDEY